MVSQFGENRVSFRAQRDSTLGEAEGRGRQILQVIIREIPRCATKEPAREQRCKFRVERAHGVFTKQITEDRSAVARAALCNLLLHMQQKVAINLAPVRYAFP